MARKTTQSREIDQHVGRRIRLLRLQRGWSQQELADRLGISYQQLHKYENGSNSISAGRMADVAAQLRCNPAVFFAGLGEEESGSNIPDELTDREQVLLREAARGAEAVHSAAGGRKARRRSKGVGRGCFRRSICLDFHRIAHHKAGSSRGPSPRVRRLLIIKG
jgi:transcriptional regulator with XRE-family HTH domain